MDSYGERLRLTTFGESHGRAIGGIIDGCPAGIAIDNEMIKCEMRRRSGGNNDGSTPRKEEDKVEWLSGIVGNTTTGTALAFMIANDDARSEDYDMLKECCRPGHADYTYRQRYGLYDHRGGGRASARETAARVVAGCIAKQILAKYGIAITSSCEVADNWQKKADSVGGRVRCTITGVPAGIGNPVFGKLNAALAAGAMSIPSATAFEMGCGIESMKMTGKEYADPWNETVAESAFANMRSPHPTLTKTNHCGGIQGGISNGMPIEFAVTFHPTVTHDGTTKALKTNGKIEAIEIGGRHDRCHTPRAAAIVEAMAALTIADYMLQQ